MADSRREVVAQAAMAALNVESVTGPYGAETTKPAGLVTHRNRIRVIAQEDGLPAIVGAFGQELVDEEVTTLSTKTLRMVFEARALAVATPPDVALDPLVTWIVKSLMADTTLGGVVRTVREVSTEWHAKEVLEGILCAADVVMDFEYDTHYQDPELAQ